MDDIHHLTARHFRYERRKIFSSIFGARKVCIAPQNLPVNGHVMYNNFYSILK